MSFRLVCDVRDYVCSTEHFYETHLVFYIRNMKIFNRSSFLKLYFKLILLIQTDSKITRVQYINTIYVNFQKWWNVFCFIDTNALLRGFGI